MYKDVADPKYAPMDCVYQCCKTSQPAFPIKCYDSDVSVEWCEPTMLCPKGTGLDKVSSMQCLCGACTAMGRRKQLLHQLELMAQG